MYFTFDASGTDSQGEFDNKLGLSDLIDNDARVTDVESLHAVIVVTLAEWCIEKGVSLDDAFPLYLYDAEIWDNDTSLRVDAGPDTDFNVWTKELAQLAWYIEGTDSNYVDKDQVFAFLSDNHWKYINFDSLEDEVNDNYHTELTDNDYEEFAREYMSNFTCESLPAHLEAYFDFEAYGADLVNDFSQLEWNGRTFLYHQ